MELSYNARRMVRQNAGPLAAAVYDVLVYHDTGDGTGVEITAQQLATEANLSVKTARRAVDRLKEAGLVKSDSQFRNNRQVANRYHPQYDLLDDGHADLLGGRGDQANTSTSNQVELVINSHVVTNSLESLVLPGEQTQEKSKEGLRPSEADCPPQDDSGAKEQACSERGHLDSPDAPSQVGRTSDKPHYLWPPRNSPMPLPVGGKFPGDKRFIDSWNNALWLVSYFEGYVVDKINQRNTVKGRKHVDEVTEVRKKAWFDNAWNLASERPVGEVATVIDWLFNTQSGYLPLWIAERAAFPENRKVTRIQQVEESYPLLLEAMASGQEPDPVDELPEAKRSHVVYGEPLADPNEEAKVAELVEVFTQFRLAVAPGTEIHHTRTWRWAKSFRIMLAHRGYGFEDLTMVVTALRDCPEMDRTRYTDAYDIDRGGEWEHVLSAARMARLRAERKRSRSPAPAWHDLDEAGSTFGYDSPSDDEPRSINLAARTPKPLGYYGRNYSGEP